MVPLVPPGPGATIASVVQSLYDAVSDLQNPAGPVQLAHVDLKANLPPADNYRGGVVICDEINSIVHSTLVTGAYVWLRANGAAL